MRLVFQYGIYGDLDENGVLHLREPFWSEDCPVQEFIERYQLAPICLERPSLDPYAHDGREVIPLSRDVAETGQIECLETRLVGKVMGADRMDDRALFLVQLLRGARYHLLQLADRYVDSVGIIASSCVRLRDALADASIAGDALPWAGFEWVSRFGSERFVWPVCMIGPLDRLHFELAAALLTTKRALDAIPRVMDRCEWAKGHGYPNGMHDTIKRLGTAADATPDDIRLRLLDSWDEWGSELRDYRTCAEHFATLAHTGVPSLTYVVSEAGLLGLVCALPDNPSANSARKFTWARGVDALGYITLAYQRTLALSTLVLDRTIPPHAGESRRYAVQTFPARPEG